MANRKPLQEHAVTSVRKSLNDFASESYDIFEAVGMDTTAFAEALEELDTTIANMWKPEDK